jgi:amino-acid N-acetyltransferase
MQDRPLEHESGFVIRRATLADVEGMHALINSFAAEGLMLAKSRRQLYECIRDFYVVDVGAEAADGNGQPALAGCGALHILWSDLGEIRSLAVAKRFQKRGIGRQLGKVLMVEADLLKLPSIFALTYQQDFFEHLGFRLVAKSTMPHKVWGECMDCPKFPNCDELAMIKDAPFTEADN